MRTLFADTLYLVATCLAEDQWHERAKEVSLALVPFRTVTTETVLIEMLNFFAEYKSSVRQAAADFAYRLLDDPQVEVVPHNTETFLAGLELYESRLDKGYSLTDCISMNVMRERGINETLTHDHHFAQEGFVVLL